MPNVLVHMIIRTVCWKSLENSNNSILVHMKYFWNIERIARSNCRLGVFFVTLVCATQSPNLDSVFFTDFHKNQYFFKNSR